MAHQLPELSEPSQQEVFTVLDGLPVCEPDKCYIGCRNLLSLDFREEKRGLAWVEELPKCPSTFSAYEKLSAYDDGKRTWSPLARNRDITRLYCMTSRKVSKSGFQQKVNRRALHFLVWLYPLGFNDDCDFINKSFISMDVASNH